MKFVNKGESEAAAYFLPYSIWAETVFNEGLDSELIKMKMYFMLFMRFTINLLKKRMVTFTIEILKNHLP